MAVRRLAALLAAAALLLAATPARAQTPDVYFTGAGWGHGVGLSQYGAKAMGAAGASAEQIINHYFTGVTIAPISATAPGTFVTHDPTPLLVGLLQNVNSVLFTVEAGRAQLCFDQGGLCVRTAVAGESYRFAPDGAGGCVFMLAPAGVPTQRLPYVGSCNASVKELSVETSLRIQYKARSYRNGTLRFHPAPTLGRLHAVYEIGVNDYMRGLSEVPDSWPSSAIEAQVIASRSLAVRTALDNGDEKSMTAQRRADCFCNLYDRAPDQVFRGLTGELSHPNWITAVQDTTSKVIGYGGTVGLGMYSSSSGGYTENHSDVFGGNAHNYLTTVIDSAAFVDSAENPHRSWTAGYDQATLADVFGFDWLSDAAVVERNDSGTARTIRLAGIADGKPVEKLVTGIEMRSALSLRSTTLDITVAPRFDDVPPGHTFAGEVLGLLELGITKGCTEERFCPDDRISRAEMAAFLVRALDLPTVSGIQPYADDDGHALEAEIVILYANGVTNGCALLRYCPDEAVSRGQMAAFLVRALGLSAVGHGGTFDDVEGHFFEDDIAALAASGITGGCTTRSFCPDRDVTRGEMAAFLIRALS